jgi:hypothetical protein
MGTPPLKHTHFGFILGVFPDLKLTRDGPYPFFIFFRVRNFGALPDVKLTNDGHSPFKTAIFWVYTWGTSRYMHKANKNGHSPYLHPIFPG